MKMAPRMSLVLVLAVAPAQQLVLPAAEMRAKEFDLADAIRLLKPAADSGNTAARVADLYLNGLIAAHEASRQGGSPESLAPVHEAMTSLSALAKGRPGPAEIGRLVLQAAAAAAQSERDEMRLYLETAVKMEDTQRAAGLPGAPLIPAAETAGDLWLQVHRYQEAGEAYYDAAQRLGSSLRILSGSARASRGLGDVGRACAAYKGLLEAWARRAAQPAEIIEARAYVAASCDEATAAR